MRRRSVVPEQDGSKIEATLPPAPRLLRPTYQRAPSSTASTKSNCGHCGNLAPKFGLTTVYGTPLAQSRVGTPLAQSRAASPFPSSREDGSSSSSQSSKVSRHLKPPCYVLLVLS